MALCASRKARVKTAKADLSATTAAGGVTFRENVRIHEQKEEDTNDKHCISHNTPHR